jgi:hypothetical protein
VACYNLQRTTIIIIQNYILEKIRSRLHRRMLNRFQLRTFYPHMSYYTKTRRAKINIFEIIIVHVSDGAAT